MKRFRVFFNEAILSTIEAETEEEARKRFLESELDEIDTIKDLDTWFDFEEVRGSGTTASSLRVNDFPDRPQSNR